VVININFMETQFFERLKWYVINENIKNNNNKKNRKDAYICNVRLEREAVNKNYYY